MQSQAGPCAPRAGAGMAPQTERLKATFSPTASHMISYRLYNSMLGTLDNVFLTGSPGGNDYTSHDMNPNYILLPDY